MGIGWDAADLSCGKVFQAILILFRDFVFDAAAYTSGNWHLVIVEMSA